MAKRAEPRKSCIIKYSFIGVVVDQHFKEGDEIIKQACLVDGSPLEILVTVRGGCRIQHYMIYIVYINM